VRGSSRVVERSGGAESGAAERRPNCENRLAAGSRARELAETKYSYDAYLERTRQACAALMTTAPALPPAAVVKDVA